MRTTGETGQVTVDDTAVEVLAPVDGLENHILVDNFDGQASGFFSIRGVAGPFVHIPAGAIVALDGITIAKSPVHIKRVAGGSNMTEVFVTVW